MDGVWILNFWCVIEMWIILLLFLLSVLGQSKVGQFDRCGNFLTWVIVFHREMFNLEVLCGFFVVGDLILIFLMCLTVMVWSERWLISNLDVDGNSWIIISGTILPEVGDELMKDWAFELGEPRRMVHVAEDEMKDEESDTVSIVSSSSPNAKIPKLGKWTREERFTGSFSSIFIRYTPPPHINKSWKHHFQTGKISAKKITLTYLIYSMIQVIRRFGSL
jgi:hypothetical protein